MKSIDFENDLIDQLFISFSIIIKKILQIFINKLLKSNGFTQFLGWKYPHFLIFDHRIS